MKKLTGWKTKGMNRDLSVSAFNAEFAFENRNLRLATNDGNTTMSWVNEKGTMRMEANYTTVLPVEKVPVSGIPIGTAIINHQLVLFTTLDDNKKDRIYVFWYNNPAKTELAGKLIFQGNLNFSSKHPVETLVSYESENIQKVYWVDGRNQPRLVNIEASDEELLKWYSIAQESINDERPFSLFNFVNEMKLREVVTVQKLLGASGMFAPGVIQYAFTYYRRYGQETNIFYTTPLYYISHKDRGGSPEDKVDNAFKITITYVDTDFDYIRVYSIQRTSVNGTPMCKRVQDIDIRKAGKKPNTNIYYASYTDTGMSGDAIDPMELLYKGGRTIIANTLEQKDNTLFFGNFSLNKVPYNALMTLKGSIGTEIKLKNGMRDFRSVDVSSGSYQYQNQLSSYTVNSAGLDTNYVPCGGFKYGDYYRLGVQFQYRTGEWSTPIYVPVYAPSDTRRTTPLDFLIENKPTYSDGITSVPVIKGTLSNTAASMLLQAGYKKIRPVVVFPGFQDRVVACQGVVSPTLYTNNKRKDGGLSAQSSWFFRTKMKNSYPPISMTTPRLPGTVAPYLGGEGGLLEYTKREVDTTDAFRPGNIRRVEIQGNFDEDNKFRVDKDILTFHSPDVEFDTQLSVTDFSNYGISLIGSAEISKTLSDIDIQTETPAASNRTSGFTHKAFKEDGPYGIVSGLFYEDMLLDDYRKDDELAIGCPSSLHKAPRWMVYLWNKNGSLNNDFNRPVNTGVQSAKLKKKIISNLRYANTSYLGSKAEEKNIGLLDGSLQLFSSDQPTILRWKNGNTDRIYQGNIDTMLTPDHTEGLYFCLNRTKTPEWWASLPAAEKIERSKHAGSAYWDFVDNPEKETSAPFNSEDWWKTYNRSEDESEDYGPRRWTGENWEYSGVEIGDDFAIALNVNKEPVRMKYKSTPHLVFEINGYNDLWNVDKGVPIVEVRRKSVDHDTIFGGKSDDALKENIWVPCGDPVFLGTRNSYGQVEFEFSYGDTYYQRWDCLKTYAFTPEDTNQVIEIGSFMLESRVNIDGRYDRNRGQASNLYISPVNFNLFNPVYSQVDNFFTYRIQDEKDYENTEFPNQVTWSKTKTSGADVDLYTNVTLASVLEMDGDKGEVRKLVRYNDQLLSFQDKGIAQVLYNENMQMSTTEGVPIEIANSGKVNGKRYITDSIGCSNKWSMVQTPSGIYFMDSINKAIFMFNGQLNNLSGTLGFNTWSKKNIPAGSIDWTPLFPSSEEKSPFVAFYDKLNQDVMFVNRDTALAFSEKLSAFTSFYDYGSTPFFCNLDDTGIWLRTFVPDDNLNVLDLGELPQNYIFKVRDALVIEGVTYRCISQTTKPPFNFVFDANGAIVCDYIVGDRIGYVMDSNVLNPGWQMVPAALWRHQAGDYCSFFGADYPFSMTLVGNPEPQLDKIFTNLEFRATVDGDGTVDGTNFIPSLPFDYLETWNEYQHGVASLANMRGHSASLHHTLDGNASLKRKFRMWRCDIPRDNCEAPENNTELNIYRTKRHPMDRMRNPWLYIKLMKEAASEGHLPRTEVHDLIMTYFV